MRWLICGRPIAWPSWCSPRPAKCIRTSATIWRKQRGIQKHIELISETARDALAHLRPADRVAIMVFAKTSEVHQDFSDNLAETARHPETHRADFRDGA